MEDALTYTLDAGRRINRGGEPLACIVAARYGEGYVSPTVLDTLARDTVAALNAFPALLAAARAGETEIRRLHELFGGPDKYEGKVGEPDLEVAEGLAVAIAQADTGQAPGSDLPEAAPPARLAGFCQDDFGREHPEADQFPVADWKYEVENGDTRLGYADWLAGKLEV